MTAIPEAVAFWIKRNDSAPGAFCVTVRCPHCGGKHGHGIPREDQLAEPGHRVADCGADAGYYIVIPTELLRSIK